MKAINSKSKIKILWKIWRGVNKISEDFNSLNTNLKVFLVGGCDTYAMGHVINREVEPGYDVIEIDVYPNTLAEGAYNLKALWTKNQGRDVLTSMRSGVFGITSNAEEAEVKDEEVRLVSMVESYGRDGMSAFETAVMQGLAIVGNEREWVGNEAERISNENKRVSAESKRVSSEADRESSETERINAEEERVESERKREEAEKIRVKTVQALKEQVNNYSPIIIEGDVTNAADEEDITSDSYNLLKLKDRTAFNGMGYKIMRIGKTFKSQLTMTYTIYEIRYDFDLDGARVAIPVDCVLRYVGGSLSNGTIVYNNTIVEGIERLNNVVTEGEFKYPYTTPDKEEGESINEQLAPTVAQVRKLSTEITNIADNEDLTKIYDSEKGQKVLQLKDRQYVQGSNNGMGYVILRKGRSFAEQVTKENTIYEIRYDFDLGGEEVEIPENCVLKFEGGSLKNGATIGNNTYIDGNFCCINQSTTLLGTYSNVIQLSWLGIYSNNDSNANTLKTLGKHSVKSYSLDSNITIKEGDLILPDGIKIFGNNYEIAFEATANRGLLILSQYCKIKNLTIRTNNSEYTGTIVLADARLNKCHTFWLEDVSITANWNEESNYKTTGFTIIASNNNKYNDAEFEPNNYITGCFIRGLRCTWVKNGIVMLCNNIPQSNYKDYVWLNEQYYSDVYVSASEYGIKCIYSDTGVNNPSNSSGYIRLKNFEFQATKNTAKMFYHSGKWKMTINSGFCWDCTYKGEIYNGGIVELFDVPGSFQNDGTYEGYLKEETLDGNIILKVETDGPEGVKVSYKQTDSVKIYDNSTYRMGLQEYINQIGIRQSDYNTYNGTEYWRVRSENSALQLSNRQNKSDYTIFRNKDNYSYCSHRIKSRDGRSYYYQYITDKTGPVMLTLSDNNVADEILILDIKRNSSILPVHASKGTTETYNIGYEGYVDINKIIEGNIKVKFKLGGAESTYVAHSSVYNNIVDFISPNLYIKGCKVLEQRFEIIEDNLYIKFKAKKTSTASYLTFSYDITYKRKVPKYIKGTTSEEAFSYEYTDEGDVVLRNFSSEYFRSGSTVTIDRSYFDTSSTTNRPELTTEDKGFQFFDTTLKKPIWWTGSKWVDATGAEV